MTLALCIGIGVIGLLAWSLSRNAAYAVGTGAPLPHPEARSVLERLETAAKDLQGRASDRWLPRSELHAWERGPGAGVVPDPRVRKAMRSALDGDERRRWDQAIRMLYAPAAWVRERNSRWLTDMLERERTWFDHVLSHPLHPDQRRAVLVDEDHNLMVAGAGTGKTATLVARIAWKVEKEQVPPGQILAMAYNAAAAKELSQRLEAMGIEGVTVSTFHALGLRLLREAEGRQAPLSPLATDDAARARFMDAQVVRLLSGDGAIREAVLRWFTGLFEEDEQPAPRTHAEYLAQERVREHRTLDGQRLRSMQEVYIANWLTLHGVEWQYEVSYEPDGKQPGGRLYRPDFFLADHGLWLEHWGISRDGTGLPGLDVRRYQDQMEWKRALHAAHGTTLLETWSDDIRDGRTDAVLRALMRRHGVPLRKLGPAEVDALVAASHGGATRFAGLLDAFLRLFRGTGHSPDAVACTARGARDRVFLSLFAPVLDAWTTALADAGQIDFDDMLEQGARAVRDRRVPVPWRHILVDELQDASRVRMQFVEALRDAVPGARVTGVGDDWQSIYRFTGADVHLFTQLEERWPGTEVTPLRQTWRLAAPSLAVSATFVQRNAAQRPKTLTARPGAAPDPVVVAWAARGDETRTAVQALHEIARRTPGASVMVVARTNWSLRADALAPLREAAESLGLRLDARTIHRAKGLETDHTMVLDMAEGRGGFPSVVQEDPVLALVKSAPEDCPFAEERRLFYVALTRARHSTWLLTPDDRPSPFVTELLETHAEDGCIEQRGVRVAAFACPECADESVILKSGPHGPFWACRHHPACAGRLPTCPDCEAAPLVRMRDGARVTWSCGACGHAPPPCPRCGEGFLQARNGRFGVFTGCSQWRREGPGCDHTRNGPPPEASRKRTLRRRPQPAVIPFPEPAPMNRPPSVPSNRRFSLPWADLGPLVFLDVETTGGGADQHIIEIAALRWQAGRETDRLVTLVDPQVPRITHTEVHRIQQSDLWGAPTWPELLPALQKVLDGATLVAHNASFEAGALDRTLSRFGGRWNGSRLCTLALARAAHPERRGRGAHTLGNLLALHGIVQPGEAHAALPDAAVLHELAVRLLFRAPDGETRARWLSRACKPGNGVVWPRMPGGGDGVRLKVR